MQGTVQLHFSADGGTTWLGASDFGASSDNIKTMWCVPYLEREPLEGDEDRGLTDAELCSQADARMYVRLQLEAKQFDLTTTAGAARYRFINALRCAPLIRLYYSGTDIYGYTDFASSSNTNYLIPHDVPAPEEITAGEEVGVGWNMTLKRKKEYDITTT